MSRTLSQIYYEEPNIVKTNKYWKRKRLKVKKCIVLLFVTGSLF